MDYHNTVIINEQKKRSSASNNVYRNVLQKYHLTLSEIFWNFKSYKKSLTKPYFSFEIYFQSSGKDHLCFFFPDQEKIDFFETSKSYKQSFFFSIWNLFSRLRDQPFMGFFSLGKKFFFFSKKEIITLISHWNLLGQIFIVLHLLGQFIFFCKNCHLKIFSQKRKTQSFHPTSH